MYTEIEFETEQKLERKQLEQELQTMMAEYQLPDWDLLDDND